MNEVNIPMFQLQILAAECALAKMTKGSHFSICPINDIMTMMGVSRENNAYKLLNVLHCVDWKDIPAELRAALPSLVREAITNDPLVDFSEVFRRRTRTVDVPSKTVEKAPPKKSGFLARLGLG